MYTLENCAKEWEDAGKHGTVSERMERTKLWLPYYAHIAAQQSGNPYTPSASAERFVSELVRSGLLRPEDRVLDIGAGMGAYTLELAKHCRRVTALDPSKPCLDILMQRGKACGLADRLEPVCGMWEDFPGEETFYLVITSMCPAICNPEELRRMESLARRGCCIITVMRGSIDRHRSAMMAGLSIRPKGGMVTEAIHYYHALYLMGRQPNVSCRTEKESYSIPEKTLLTQYPIYFRIFGVTEEVSLPFLKQYLAQHEEGGGLLEESTIHYAMITWNTTPLTE